METTKIGTHQELLPGGIIAESWMRKAETAAFIFWFLLTTFQCVSYELHFFEFSGLLRAGKLSEQTFETLILQLKMIDWSIFLIGGVFTFSPKAAQKFAEVKGLK